MMDVSSGREKRSIALNKRTCRSTVRFFLTLYGKMHISASIKVSQPLADSLHDCFFKYELLRYSQPNDYFPAQNVKKNRNHFSLFSGHADRIHKRSFFAKRSIYNNDLSECFRVEEEAKEQILSPKISRKKNCR
jgi:hypothetical protein